jgi:hypothetical protein
MSADVTALLARTPLVVRRGPYALGAWAPAQAGAVGSALMRRPPDLLLWMRDDKEVTALYRESAHSDLPAPRNLQRGFAVITPDRTMAWDLTGVLAALAGALAAAGVPLGAFSAYSRDHLLVPGAQLDAALAALAPFCPEVRRLD